MPKWEELTLAPKMTDAERSADLERTAREHDAGGNETDFNEALRKLAKPKKAS